MKTGLVRIAPTLATMAKIYELSLEGGPTSPRFQQYRARGESDWGLVPYNPMAGTRTGAVEAVAQLQKLDAETVAKQNAEAVVGAAAFAEDLTLAVVVRAPGMWTDRLATDVQIRASPLARPLHGLINFWSTDEISADDLRRESAAETVRVVWSFLHPGRVNASAIFQREGLAYAVATRLTSVAHPFGKAAEGEREAVRVALELLGDSTAMSDAASILFGDETAAQLGWTPLGLPTNAGCRYAIAQAERAIASHGIMHSLAALRLEL